MNKGISTGEIRREFLDYFAQRDHQVFASAPLVPGNDPTLMFTNAGMVQFKDVFTGRRRRQAPRGASVQKCIRITGKHNDLENVGRTSRHHTFFEMLGNFSFGDYFKKEACRFGWELLTSVLGMDPDRLWVTVFGGDDAVRGDDEAARIWSAEIGVPAERILRGGTKDNFWAMGDVGPCGPCSEILYDRGDAFGPAEMANGERFFELWNLVFMQYMVSEVGGEMTPLPAPSIDTGAGLERIASVLQGVDSNYDTDLFRPLVALAAEIAGVSDGDNDSDDMSLRVIADHARMAAFLIAEGVFPEKTGREYVLRRVMRRAIRHGHRLGIQDLFFHRVADRVVELMEADYPELGDHRQLIDRICRQEEERFRHTLGRGLELLSANTDWQTGPAGQRLLPGATAFDLTATYGFPKDLIEVIGEEDGFVLDQEGYAQAALRHRLASGAGKIGEQAVDPVYEELHNSLGDTRFSGYDDLCTETQVLAIVLNGSTVEQARAGQQAAVVLADTPFYGEAGGQLGDSGEIRAREGKLTVVDTERPLSGLWIHQVKVEEGRIRVGDSVEARVDGERRNSIRRHHTATHLLHLALRRVLGPHATQKGSRVGPTSLRFDFAHFEPLSPDQVTAIEDLVAREVLANHPVQTETLSFSEARQQGAIALFEENYGETVRLVTACPESKELCGGTHVRRTGDIGPVLITAQGSVAAGVRRLEAVAGVAAHQWLTERRGILDRAAALLKTEPGGLVEKVEKTLARERELVREVEQLKRKIAGGGPDLLERVRQIQGINVLGARVDLGDPTALREAADNLRGRLGSGVVCLGGEHKGKASVLVAVTGDLTGKLNAGKLIREVAAVIGGRGGGRPDLAQAGGPDLEKLDAAVDAIYGVVDRSQRHKEGES